MRELKHTIELDQKVVYLIDQRKLPTECAVLECRSYRQVGEAIRTLAVRGAPAIGVVAAAGIALAALELAVRHREDKLSFWNGLTDAANYLRNTRPTAVNLSWAIDRVMALAGTMVSASPAAVAEEFWQCANGMAQEDIRTNRAMALQGRELIDDGDGVLTHCNTGALACVDYGTAFGVIRAAHEVGKRLHLYVDETRPVLQGARLTAWEAVRYGIPATLIPDSATGYLMQIGKIQKVFVGADRIAAGGDTANKIGTYQVAVLAKEHRLPFYVVAPTSTIDLKIMSGAEIPIEERSREEVTHIAGVQVAPDGIGVANPAFDVTPARLITGIITEKGIATPPFERSLRGLVEGG